MIVTADQPIIWDPSWASPICPKDREHQFVTVKTSRWNGIICDCCGAMVRTDEMIAVLSWWRRIEQYVSEDWGRN